MREYLKAGLHGVEVELDDAIIEKELCYLDELLRWNKKINLTSITEKAEAVEKHLIDSLLALNYLTNIETVLDMGSGGGLPGIPLAIANQWLSVTSVDSVGKKINFQKHIKRKLQLLNLHSIHARVESLDQINKENMLFDCVVTRAFSSFETIVKYAAVWCRPGGVVLAMKGPEGVHEIEKVEPLLKQYGFGELTVNKHLLPYSQAERYIIRTCKNL